MTDRTQAPLRHLDRASLVNLSDATTRARAEMMAARRRPRDGAGLAGAHGVYLRALREYAEALQQHAIPLPPKLRDELRLLRGLSCEPVKR